MILAGIYVATGLRDYLVLKGGNCLRKAYFENARFSGDLDFAARGALRPDFVATELVRACEYVRRRAGIEFQNERLQVQEKRGADKDRTTYEARLYFKDFYGNPDKFVISIRLDMTEFARIHLPVQERGLVHPYSDRRACCVPVRCLKLEELLAGKLKCLLQRRHSADLYDFAYSILLNREMAVDRSEIVRTFLRMTIFRPSPGIVKGLLLDLPFQLIKALWQKYLVFPKRGTLDFEDAVGSFKVTVGELFGGLPIRGGERLFFPSHLRNPIMDAGHGMTLLKLTYDGVERLVEPYCLVYKTRRDGLAREYFYVYDLTGGRQSGPGIKCLVHPKIQSMHNTDTSFEPRFPVELCKAGENLGSSYFARPPGRRASAFRPIPHRRVGRRASAVSQKPYAVKCPYCGKTFPRSTPSTHLNPHKDQHGNRCYGKQGCPM